MIGGIQAENWCCNVGGRVNISSGSRGLRASSASPPKCCEVFLPSPPSTDQVDRGVRSPTQSRLRAQSTSSPDDHSHVVRRGVRRASPRHFSEGTTRGTGR